MYNTYIYKNLAAEMIKRNVSVIDIKELLKKKTDTSVRYLLQGKAKMSLESAELIRVTFFDDCNYNYLFEKS